MFAGIFEPFQTIAGFNGLHEIFLLAADQLQRRFNRGRLHRAFQHRLPS
jgi:hypothetical protein